MLLVTEQAWGQSWNPLTRAPPPPAKFPHLPISCSILLNLVFILNRLSTPLLLLISSSVLLLYAPNPDPVVSFSIKCLTTSKQFLCPWLPIAPCYSRTLGKPFCWFFSFLGRSWQPCWLNLLKMVIGTPEMSKEDPPSSCYADWPRVESSSVAAPNLLHSPLGTGARWASSPGFLREQDKEKLKLLHSSLFHFRNTGHLHCSLLPKSQVRSGSCSENSILLFLLFYPHPSPETSETSLHQSPSLSCISNLSLSVDIFLET